MTPEVAAIVGAVVGGVIGFAGAWLSAGWTTRQTRVARERQSRQHMLRLLPRVDRALEAEREAADDRAPDGWSEAMEAVDDLAEELRIAAAETGEADRVRLRLCANAVYDRASMGPNPYTVGTRAVSAMRRILHARLYEEECPRWATDTVKELEADLRLVEEMREQSHLDRQEYEREQREAAQRSAMESAGED